MIYLFGFDPSLNGMGYCVLEASRKSPRLVEVGTVKGRNKTWGDEDTHQVRLALIASKTRELVAKYRPAHSKVYIERGFSNKYVNATQLAFKARGAMESELVGFELVEIPATSVKKIIASYGHASKASVADSVADLLKVDKSVFNTEDESDAAAVAVIGFLKMKEEEQ